MRVIDRQFEFIAGGLCLVGLALLRCSSQFAWPSVIGDIGFLLLLCSGGALLGCFPVPRISGPDFRPDSLVDILVRRQLPCLAAGGGLLVVTWWVPLSGFQIGFLGVIGLLIVGSCTLRLSFENRHYRRLALSVFMTLGWLCVTICYSAWERTHIATGWQLLSNWPSGQTLFLSILGCETAAVCLSAAAFRFIVPDRTLGDHCELTFGAVRKRPFPGILLVLGELSLSGIAPLPGFWWRWSLVGAAVLPHRRNNLNGLAEPNDFFLVLGLAILALWILGIVARLSLVVRVVGDEPFRIPEPDHNWRDILLTGLAVSLFAYLTLMPLSLGPKFDQVVSEEASP